MLKTGLSTFPQEQHIFSRTVQDFSAEGHYSHELGTAYTRHRIAHRNTAQHFNSRVPFWLKRGQSLQHRTTQRNTTQRHFDPIWFGLGPCWSCIGRTCVRTITDLDPFGPMWMLIGSVLDLHWAEIDTRENRSGSDRSDMDSG